MRKKMEEKKLMKIKMKKLKIKAKIGPKNIQNQNLRKEMKIDIKKNLMIAILMMMIQVKKKMNQLF